MNKHTQNTFSVSFYEYCVIPINLFS